MEIKHSDISDLRGADKLQNLRSVNLMGNPNLTSLRELEKCETLEHVGVSDDLEEEARRLEEKTGVEVYILSYEYDEAENAEDVNYDHVVGEDSW